MGGRTAFQRRSIRSAGRSLVAVLALQLVAGCHSVPLDAAAPVRFDLNGHWVLDPDRSDGPRPRAGGFLTQDFPVLVAKEMRIEQDDTSMGIEFDRGSYRDISWGERRRGVWEIRAGWHEGALYIYSEAPDTSAEEIWRLSDDGDEVTIEVSIRGMAAGRYQRIFQRSLEI